VLFQHTSINDQVSTNYNGVTRAWGGTFNIVYKTQVSEFHLNASRTITPSGASTLYTVDTLQFQYKLSQSARWQFTGAVIGLHTRALNVSATNDDRSYAQVLLQEKWMMTPNWFLQGGYQYQWQKYQTDTISATNDRIFLRIGYQGLPKQ
jgi:hypothetical protein